MGTEEAVTALDRLLIDVVEKVADLEQQQEKARAEAALREEALLAKGAAIRQMDVERRRDRVKAGVGLSDRGDHEFNHGVGSAGRAAVEPAQRMRRNISELDSGDMVEVIVGSRAHRISAASHCTSAAFLRSSHFRKLRTTGLQMSSYVIPNAWILCKAMSSF